MSLLPLAMYLGSLFILQKQYYIFSPSVDWEEHVQKPWLPENVNAGVANSTTEVIAEKAFEKLEEKDGGADSDKTEKTL